MPDRDQRATMTVEQAGKLLGISRRSAYRAVADGHIPTIRLGRRILVPTARLHRMLGLTADGNRPDGDTGQLGNGGPSSLDDQT
jgi:excisionase family DNA binding protein